MKNIQVFLKRGNIEGTLLNSHDEAYYLGPATTVRPQKNDHYLRWDIKDKPDNIFPFDTLVIHTPTEIIDTLGLAHGSYQEGKVVELHYGRD